MPSPIDYKTLVNVEMGFLYVSLKLRLENSTQNGNMKKNVFFAPLFLHNLALITHDATKSVNPSISKIWVTRCPPQLRTVDFLFISILFCFPFSYLKKHCHVIVSPYKFANTAGVEILHTLVIYRSDEWYKNNSQWLCLFFYYLSSSVLQHEMHLNMYNLCWQRKVT